MKTKTDNRPEENVAASAVPLAIVGIGCLFPGANDPHTYWSNIRDGVDAITEVPTTHWNPDDYFDKDKNAPDMTYARRGGFINPVDFDPLLYGMSPNNIEATDTTQLLGMVVARQALLDAGYATGRDSKEGRQFDRNRTSVILGVTGTLELVIPLGARLGHPIWRKALADAGVDQTVAEEVVDRISAGYVPWQENSFPGLLGNVAAGRIANRFDLGGTNCVVDAACASSLSAIHLAALELYSGRSDMAITGGFDTFNDIFMYMCFSKTPALSPTGNSKPFDSNGDGTILGEGLGAIVLKRLADAERDGDNIYAVLRGIGSSSDGRGNAIYAPSANGQTRALKNAYREAGISPATIELVEAHGTGTRVGDAVEAEALSSVYREARADGSWCAIGSVKSMIGHTKAAAGVAGLIKVAMALKHKVLPPTIKVTQPLDVLSPGKAPVYVNSIKRPWIANADHPRRGAISAFGFGGSNFHCVLEEAQTTGTDIDWDGQVLLLALGAHTRQSLSGKLNAIDLKQSWTDLRSTAARSLQQFSSSDVCRLLFVITPKTGLDKLFNDARQMLQKQDLHQWSLPEGAWFGTGKPAGKLAMLFPGQGSQYPDMLLDLACQFPQMQTVLAEADHIFSEMRNGQLLNKLIYPLPVFNDEARAAQTEALRATSHAQPAIGAVSLGALRILEHLGIRAEASAGHSFGELTALCAAGRIDSDSLHRLAIKRGELMQLGAGDHGSMLAVSSSAAVIHEILEAEQLDLIIANNNAPRQVVLSGASEQIKHANEILKKRGLSAKVLTVSAAFHSSFVSAAEKPFAQFMQAIRFRTGKMPVYANTTSERYPDAEAAVRQLLAQQLAQPVEFVAEIENMYAAGIRTFIETGPGNTLTGLVKSILGEREHTAIALDSSKGKLGGQYDLACALARITCLGHENQINLWDSQWLQQGGTDTQTKPGMTIKLTGANYVKPRPPVVSIIKDQPRMQTKPTTSNATAASVQTRTATAAVVTNTPALTPTVMGGDQAALLLQTTQQSILALQQMQEQTAALHRSYLEGQQAAQQSIQKLIQQQQQLLSGTPVSFDPAPLPAAMTPSVIAISTKPATSIINPVVPQPATTIKPAHTAPIVTVPVAATGQLETILLQVIAEKTGYPVEMLSMEMSLDTDLGIDSIKRVEILSGLQEKLPGIRKIQPEDLGTFRLLKHIIEYLAVDEEADGTPAQVNAPVSRVIADPDLQQTLLEVVADKTGYPVDMLRLEMNLDSDLGIDSIKRVEILSAFQERRPDAPTVNPEDMAVLQTLQQIVEYMQVRGGQTVISTGYAPITHAPTSALTTTLLEVVADKTGYPVDMLRLDMNLDTDLGIDSIKRVEILSAFQERMPDAPTVNPEHLATLQTLQQIVSYMQASGSPMETGTVTATVRPVAQVFDQALLEVVADKTGYPVDMLRLDMNLDTDLGIDSIKRVEILSAFQERMPDAPTVNPEHMATLQTLQQIIDYMNQDTVATKPAPTLPATAVALKDKPDNLWRGIVTVAPLDATATRQKLSLPAQSVVLVTDDGDGLAAAICAQLNTSGLDARLIGLKDTRPDAIAGLIIVAAPQPDANFNADAFELIRHYGAVLKQTASSQPALLVGITSLGGNFGIEHFSNADPSTGGLAGLIKSADKEWPQVCCRVIDTDYTGSNAIQMAAAVGDELLHESPLETGLQGGQRSTLSLVNQPITDRDLNKPAPVTAGDVIVISGGARGITAEIAVELAVAFRTNLLLLGRSLAPGQEPAWLLSLRDEASIKRGIIANSPDKLNPKQLEARYRELMAGREILGTLERIAATGVKVSYRSVDIRNAAEVGQALAQARQELGPIRGLIHAAGVLADRSIEDKTREQFAEVYSTKVDGLRSLLAASQDDDLKLMVMFSSSTGRFGRKGQIDYAAANEVLNKTAQQQQRLRPDCRVISVNWGPWDGGMVTPGLKQLFESEGVGVIPLRVGAQYLVNEISTPGSVELVILGSAPAISATTQTSPGATIHNSSPVGLTTSFERTISIEDIPVLESHVMNGKAVLPTALIAEWLTHGAMHNNPGLSFNGFDNLAIFKGVILETSTHADLQILAGDAIDADGMHRVPVELRQGKLLHAGASIVLGTEPVQTPVATNPAIIGTYSIADANLYHSSRLFHSKDLYGIEAITGYSDRGISARVRPAPQPSAWMKQPLRNGWLADPLALDSAFQLMILWCFEKTGHGSLPTCIRKYRQFRRDFPKDGTSINLLVESIGKHEASASIEFVDMKGKLVARIDGYECVIDASLNEVFKRNRLETEPQA